MSGLGQAGPNPYVEYMSSLKRAEAQIDYLEKATASNWEFRVDNALKSIPNEFKAAEIFVRGKTGNPEAEDQLFKLWGAASKAAIQMNANKPGVMAQLKDKVSIFFTDFWKGAQEAQQGYANWAIEKSPWVLKAYHGGLQKIALLKADLAEAKKAGRPAAEISAQEQKIAEAESRANKVRSTFSAISAGASIDKLATDKYGALSGPIAGLFLSAAISLVMSAVGWFLVALADIKPLINRLMPMIDRIDKAIYEASKGANIALTTAKEKVEILIPVVIGAVALIAGGAFYYFVIRKRSKTE
jgi:hypothetical protein